VRSNASPGAWLRLGAFAGAAVTLVAVVSGTFGPSATHSLLSALALPPLLAVALAAWFSYRRLLPASVVALVTRKTSDDKAAQMGDVLVDQIPGGLTVMSSIVPPRGSDGGRRRMSPTQSPYFRVLEKGERLPSKPGRADDFAWPR